MSHLESGNREGGRHPALAAGQVLASRYRIVSFLGQGAVGEVYEAEDLELGERIAIKILRPEIADDERVLQRFKREIQLARRVTHPNVCRVFDLVKPEGAPGPPGNTGAFLTMELLRGETLEQRLAREGRMSTAEALPVIGHIAAALAAAHENGVVHRDLKSGNVFLVPALVPTLVPTASGARAGRAVVTDFGLAWSSIHEDSSASLTATGELVGSPAYMAPEQVRGEEATPATDIYALGVVMFEMITGELPFVGKSAFYTALKRLQEPAPSPRVHLSDLDPAWETTILRCLERDPAARFPTVRHVARSLGATKAEEDATSPLTLVRDGRARRRLRGVLTASVCAFLLALVSCLVWVLGVRPLVRQGPAGGPIPESSSSARRPVPLKARPAVAVLGFSNLTDAEDTNYLGSSLFQMLPTELARTAKLRLVPAENVNRARQDLGISRPASLSRETLARLRNLLGADFVVSGSYLVSGPDRRTRFDLLVQDTRTGETLAAFSESGTETGFLTTLPVVGERLRNELGAGRLADSDAEGLRAALPATLEAARLYAEGTEALRRSDALQARDLLRRAVTVEPSSPLFHTALASAWSDLGYQERAKNEAKVALDLAGALRREDRRLIEARHRELANGWPEAIGIYQELWGYFPDNLEYGLRLAAAQTTGGLPKEALATLEEARKLPPPQGSDARIDLAEADAAKALSDFARQRRAALAAEQKGRRWGAQSWVGEARLQQGSAALSLGELEAATAALDGALQIFGQTGDKVRLARAITFRGILLEKRGDLAGAEASYRQTGEIYRALGNEYGQAASINNLAILDLKQGRLAEAKQQLTTALSSFLRLDRKAAAANALTNLGVIAQQEGDLDTYDSTLRQVLTLYREIGDRGAEARTLIGYGAACFIRGNLRPAGEAFEDALAIYQKLGDRANTATALEYRGAVLLRSGDLAGAERLFLEGRSIQKELDEKPALAETALDLAWVALEKGDPGRAGARAAEARDLFHGIGNAERESEAVTVLALCRLAGGDPGAARKLIETAKPVAGRSENLRFRLFFSISEGRVLAGAGQLAEAKRVLERAVREAPAAGSVPEQLEATLALGEVEILTGDTARGRARLAALERDSQAKGFALIARKAARARAAA